MNKEVTIRIPEGVSIIAALEDVKETMISIQSNNERFDSISEGESDKLGVEWEVNEIEVSEYESIDGYAMVNVLGAEGFSILVEYDTNEYSSADILDELVKRGQLTSEQARYADIDDYICQYEINQIGEKNIYKL